MAGDTVHLTQPLNATGSYSGTFVGPVTGNLQGSASFATTASTATSITFTPTTASYAITSSQADAARSASAATSITFIPPTASYAVTASQADMARSASAALSITFVPTTASFATEVLKSTGGFTVSGVLLVSGNTNHAGYFVSASGFSGNGANVTGVVSSSFATTASAATSITFQPASASFATTASAATSITFIPVTASYAATASAAAPTFVIGTDPGAAATASLRVGPSALFGAGILQKTGSTSVRFENSGDATPAGATAQGVEIIGNFLGDAYLQVYNRSTNAYGPLRYDASAHKFQQGAVIIGTDPGGAATLRVGGRIRLGASGFVAEPGFSLGAGITYAGNSGSGYEHVFTDYAGANIMELLTTKAINIDVGPLVVGTDPGGSETLRVSGTLVTSNHAKGGVKGRNNAGNASLFMMGIDTGDNLNIGRDDAIASTQFFGDQLWYDDDASPAQIMQLTNLGELKLLANTTMSFGTTKVLEQHPTYHILYDRSGNRVIHLGGSGDQANYYSNTVHNFRSLSSALWVVLNSSGLSVRQNAVVTGSLQVTGSLSVNTALVSSATGSISNTSFGEASAEVTWSTVAASGVKPNGTIWIQY